MFLQLRFSSFFCRMRFNDSKPFWKRGPKFPWGPMLGAFTLSMKCWERFDFMSPKQNSVFTSILHRRGWGFISNLIFDVIHPVCLTAQNNGRHFPASVSRGRSKPPPAALDVAGRRPAGPLGRPQAADHRREPLAVRPLLLPRLGRHGRWAEVREVRGRREARQGSGRPSGRPERAAWGWVQHGAFEENFQPADQLAPGKPLRCEDDSLGRWAKGFGVKDTHCSTTSVD